MNKLSPKIFTRMHVSSILQLENLCHLMHLSVDQKAVHAVRNLLAQPMRRMKLILFLELWRLIWLLLPVTCMNFNWRNQIAKSYVSKTKVAWCTLGKVYVRKQIIDIFFIRFDSNSALSNFCVLLRNGSTSFKSF